MTTLEEVEELEMETTKSVEDSIDWNLICNLLLENNFNSDNNKINLFVNEIKQCLKDEEFDSNGFIIEICNEWINNKTNNNNNDNNNIFIEIFNKFNYNKDEINQFYDILLFKYLRPQIIDDLLFIKILKTLILDTNNNINITKFEENARKNQLSGYKFIYKINKNEFISLFEINKSNTIKLEEIYDNICKLWNISKIIMDSEEEEEKKEELSINHLTIRERAHSMYDEILSNDDIIENDYYDDIMAIPNIIQNDYDKLDPLPFYINKLIFNHNNNSFNDKQLEKLIDISINKISNLAIWNNIEEIKKIYSDLTYYDFINEIYSKFGNTFFDNFINEINKNEISKFLYKRQQIINYESDYQIFEAIQKTDFKEFDFDKNKYIDINEFMTLFYEKGFNIPQNKLIQIFDDIDSREIKDGKITITEYKVWKELLQSGEIVIKQPNELEEKTEENIYWNVYYHDNRYYFTQNDNKLSFQKNEKITILNNNVTKDNKYIWAVFVPKLTKQRRLKFINNHNGTEIPIGYWKILSNDNNNQIPIKSISAETISVKHLNLIFQLLHYYYTLKLSIKDNNNLKKINDNSPLMRQYVNNNNNNEHEDNKYDFDDNLIIFNIENEIYELKWWNQNGRYEPNALSIKNETGFNKRQNEIQLNKGKITNINNEAKNLCYLRFTTEINNLLWEWYDNDSSQYVEFDMDVYPTLEASFLSNINTNYNPQIFKHNNCLLPILRNNLHKKGISSSDEFSFRITFSNKYKILNMEQIGWSHNQQTRFPRNIRRIIDGRNTLLTYDRNSNIYIEKWKINYNLYTIQQQKYFFSIIITLVTMIKYINIQILLQPILLSKIDTQKNKLNLQQETFYYKPKNIRNPVRVSSLSFDEHNKTQSILSFHSIDPHQFTKIEADFCRFTECIRQFIFGYESITINDGMLQCLHPWYQNAYYYGQNISNNMVIMAQYYPFLYSWDITSVLEILHLNDNISDDNVMSCIRMKRKFAAQYLLNINDIKNNLNIIKAQLHPLLVEIMKEIKKVNNFDVNEYIENMISKNGNYWCNKIETVNQNLKDNILNHKTYLLFKSQLQNIEYLNINENEFPIFEQFMLTFFIFPDKNNYDIISNGEHFKGLDHTFYRAWSNYFRITTPNKWYTYNHDILLLELLLRNGIKYNKIINDLKSSKNIQYRIRLRSNEIDCTDYQYYKFIQWCKIPQLVLHRLKYITKTILTSLQNPKIGGKISLLSIRIAKQKDIPNFDGKSSIFSDYQRATHIEFLKIANHKYKSKVDNNTDAIVINKSTKKDKNYSSIELPPFGNRKRSKSPLSSSKNKYDLITNIEDEDMKDTHNHFQFEEQKVEIKHTKPLSKFKRSKPSHDPFIERDLLQELNEILQLFDLNKYAKPMTLFLLKEIQKHSCDGYWIVLCELMSYLPFADVVSIILNHDKRYKLKNITPDISEKLAVQLVNKADFPAAIALFAADLFSKKSTQNHSDEPIWCELANKFENIAYNKLMNIENSHLRFILFNSSLPELNGESMLSLCLISKHTNFLKREGVHIMIDQLYHKGYIPPNETFTCNKLSFWDMSKNILCYPFDFYLSNQGYEWISNTMILAFTAYFIYFISVYNVGASNLQSTKDIVLESILWYWIISIFIHQCVIVFKHNGIIKHFNLNLNIPLSLLDIIVNSIWIPIFIIRIYYIVMDKEFKLDPDRRNRKQRSYQFLFSIQLTLILIKAGLIFSNKKLLKIMELLLVESYKYFYLFVICILSILAGCYFIVGIGTELDEINITTLWNELESAWTYDTDVEQQILIVFYSLVVVLIIVVLIDLISLIEYEPIKLKAENIFMCNKIESMFNDRSMIFPPPLNLIAYLITFIIIFINFWTSLLSPLYLNIFAYINHTTLINLKNCIPWICRCCSVPRANKNILANISRTSLLNWYFAAICPCCCRNKILKIHHKGCYTAIINTKSNKISDGNVSEYSVDGLSLIEYYEEAQQVGNYGKMKQEDMKTLEKLAEYILICKHCYKPFLNTDNGLQSELETPYKVIIDIVSSIMFLIVPIAWIPLVLLLLCLSLFEKITDCCKESKITSEHMVH